MDLAILVIPSSPAISSKGICQLVSSCCDRSCSAIDVWEHLATLVGIPPPCWSCKQGSTSSKSFESAARFYSTRLSQNKPHRTLALYFWLKDNTACCSFTDKAKVCTDCMKWNSSMPVKSQYHCFKQKRHFWRWTHSSLRRRQCLRFVHDFVGWLLLFHVRFWHPWVSGNSEVLAPVM